MDIKKDAFEFAVKAHKGQVRKSDTDKLMIFHPINVANILKDYDFDENVIAAGYLHDVVEDTKYTIEDIEEYFGKDIASLVYGASEPDKSLSWEERKQHTIDTVKLLDLRHKAVVCADKISNLEDIRILMAKDKDFDFKYFKRGYDKQKWYYTNIYESLIYNEDEGQEIFKKLKEIIDYVFYDKKNDEYFKEVIFNDNILEYDSLVRLHYKKQEIYKLSHLLPGMKPYVIEITGTPRTGKTSVINDICDFLEKGKFKVSLIEEFTSSKYYKQTIKNNYKSDYKKLIYDIIPEEINNILDNELQTNPDIIIADRCLLDRIVWINRYYLKNGLSEYEYEEYINNYIRKIKDKINLIIAFHTDSLVALKRDYHTSIALEDRNFLNCKNLDEYNESLNNVIKIAKQNNFNYYYIDATEISKRNLAIKTADLLLDSLRKFYIEELKEKLSEFDKN